MSNFKGNNDLGARDLFNYRSIYKAYALPARSTRPRQDMIGVRDFNEYSNIFYGKYAFGTFASIRPREELLVRRDGVEMLNFVALALDDMMENYEKAERHLRLNTDDRYLQGMALKSGYVNVGALHRAREKSVIAIVESYIRRNRLQSEIVSFEDYVNVCKTILLETVDRLPFTRAGFSTTRFAPMRGTGLTVAFSFLDASVDQPKVDDFYRSPNFGFYRNSAIYHGFLINKNAPWQLVADLGSPQIKKYLRAAGVDENLLQGNFRSAFEEVTTDDISIIRDLMIDSYADFVSRNRYYRLEKAAGYGGCSSAKLVRRRPLTAARIERLKSKYNDEYWIPLYNEIRFAESGLDADPATINFTANNALQIYATSGIAAAIAHIQRKTFNIIAVEGSLLYNSKKRLTGDEDRDILEEVQREVLNEKYELF